MHSAPKTDVLEDCLRSVLEKDPLITLRKEKSDNSRHQGSLCFTTACSCGPEYTEIHSPTKVLVQPWPSCTEIAAKAFLKRRDR